MVGFATELGLREAMALNKIERILRKSTGMEEELVSQRHSALTQELARDCQGTIAYRRKLLAGLL